MRIWIDAVSPAQVNFMKNIIERLLKDGNEVLFTVRPRKDTLLLLNHLNLDYKIVGSYKKHRTGKIFYLPNTVFQLRKEILKYKPEISFGQIYISLSTIFTQIPSIIFLDDEVVKIQRFFHQIVSDTIITPEAFRYSFRKKHIRMKGYKELSYLHPHYFKPDKEILNLLDVGMNERYVIIRWNTWDAIHDVGQSGFDYKLVLNAIKKLEQYSKVFISTNRKLPKLLQKYEIKIPFDKIHHALYYAQLLLSDTQTMSTEAAILGTPTVRCNSFVGEYDDSNFIELEKRYHLMFNFRNPKDALEKAVNLVKDPNIKDVWKKRRERLLQDKIDVTAFMVWFIENYPESFNIMRENPAYQERFK